MTNNDYSYSFISSQAPEQIFETLLNVRNWWVGIFTESIEGDSSSEFTFKAGEGMHYTKHKLIESVPNEKITWEVTDSRLSFAEKKDEWTGTKMGFEITETPNGSEVTFTHHGLVPTFECYQNCASAWTMYLEKLSEQLK